MKYFAAFMLTLPLLFTASLGHAAPAVDTLEISQARIFAPIKGTNTTAGYATLKNNGTKAVVVTVVSADQFKQAEMHETKEVAGKMSMEKLEQLTLKPQEVFEFKPGGNHIMLFDALRPLKLDETLKVSFMVDGQKKSYDFKVVPRVMGGEMHHQH